MKYTSLSIFLLLSAHNTYSSEPKVSELTFCDVTFVVQSLLSENKRHSSTDVQEILRTPHAIVIPNSRDNIDKGDYIRPKQNMNGPQRKRRTEQKPYQRKQRKPIPMLHTYNGETIQATGYNTPWRYPKPASVTNFFYNNTSVTNAATSSQSLHPETSLCKNKSYLQFMPLLQSHGLEFPYHESDYNTAHYHTNSQHLSYSQSYGGVVNVLSRSQDQSTYDPRPYNSYNPDIYHTLPEYPQTSLKVASSEHSLSDSSDEESIENSVQLPSFQQLLNTINQR